jgi:hypothetical protein
MPMIVVVEGPSAAGKTAWRQGRGRPAVAQLDPTRAVWQFLDKALAGLPEVPTRPDRSDPTLLDALPPLPPM